jgi:hypothetical protein
MSIAPLSSPRLFCRGDRMSLPAPLTTLEEFKARAAATGLALTPEDIEHLHAGYVGLLGLMERMPSRFAWEAELPLIFRADE